MKEFSTKINELIINIKEKEIEYLRNLYMIIYNTEPIEDDPELTEKEAENLCLQGDKAFYMRNEGMLPDYKLALQLYNDAALCGSARACGCIGRMYQKGLGTEANPKIAAEFFKMGTEMDDPYCTFMLGWCYENKDIGEDMTENDRNLQIFELYQLAAKNKNSDAMTKLGYM